METDTTLPPSPFGAPPAKTRLLAPLVASALGVAFLGSAVYAYQHHLGEARTISGLRALGEPAGDLPFSELDARLAVLKARYLDGEVILRLGADRLRVRRRGGPSPG